MAVPARPAAGVVAAKVSAKVAVPGEHFGGFVIRAGYVREIRAGREFNG